MALASLVERLKHTGRAKCYAVSRPERNISSGHLVQYEFAPLFILLDFAMCIVLCGGEHNKVRTKE